MGLSIQVAGASFSKVLTSLTLPDRRNLIAEYVFGGDFASSARNLANAAMPLLEVGTPVYGTNYARVQSGTGGFGFNTQITPLVDCTMIDVRGTPSNTAGSTYTLAAGAMGMYHRSGNFLFKGGTYSSLDMGALNNNGESAWNFTAGVSNIGGGIAKHLRGNSATGVLSEAIAANARLAGSTGIAYLGTANCTSTVSAVQHSHAYLAIFDRILASAEIDAIYQSLRPYMARRGIII